MKQTIIAAAVATAFCSAGAQAFEIQTDNPDLQLRWDNTVRYNLGVRTDSQNKSGIGNNALFDEGEFSFKRGDIVTNRVDVLTELDLVYRRNMGLRVSGALWYDNAYSDATATRNPAINPAVPGSYIGDRFTDYTKRYYKGPSGELLDAFVFGKFDIAETPVALKAGRHTVFWGESLLLNGALHGISYSQAPIDLAKGFATPGAEAKELFRPLSNLSGQVQATKDLSIAGQYFFDWEPYRYPEGGTFLGPADFAFTGPQQVRTGAGLLPNSGIHTPSRHGDWGLAARWSPEWLDGTAGVYYRNYTDKLLSLLVTGGVAPSAANPLGLQYSQFYGENVDLWGVSLAKQIAGVSFGSEISYRHNTPLAAQTAGLTPSALVGPLAPLAAFLFPNSAANTTLNGNTFQARGNTWHVVLNGLGVIPKTPVFDSATYAAELTYSRLDSVTANPDMFYGEGYGVCRSALSNPALPAAVRAQYRDKWDGCATKDHIGLAINFTPVWFQVFPGWDLSTPLAWSQTLKGNSPLVLGGNERNGNFSIGLGADYQMKYRFDLKYVDFFGRTKSGTDPVSGLPAVTSINGLSTLLKDRGHVVLTFKTTF